MSKKLVAYFSASGLTRKVAADTEIIEGKVFRGRASATELEVLAEV